MHRPSSHRPTPKSTHNRHIEPILTALALVLGATALPAQTLPELPALDRSVALIEDGASRYPHLPPLRTSADGRVGLNIKNKKLFLISPERLSTPFLDSPDGVTILASTTGIQLANSQLHTYVSQFELRHAALCDRGSNPRACGADDCYDLTIITPVLRTGVFPNVIELWSTDFTLRVSQPKTAAAQMTLESTQPPHQGPTHPANTLFETMVTADGKLLVGRVGNGHQQWPGIDIVYAVAPVDETPCNVDGWTQLQPITMAHSDPLMAGRYGIAAYPLRDPLGNLIPSGSDLRGTYPWIDRHGNNLFFTTVSATLWYQPVGSTDVVSRYPAACVAGTNCIETVDMTLAQAQDHDETSDTRGVSMAGLWTHGKIVTLDGILNNTDYGMKIPAVKQRMLQLYEPGSGPLGNESGQVRVGTGRHNGPESDFPPGFVNNSTFIDSVEQLHNANTHLKPLTPRDVVWIVDTGHASAEVIFDDWIDPNAFIVSEMTAAMSWSGSVLSGKLDYFDGFERAATGNGWRGHGFTGNQPLRMQNAATNPGTEWNVPLYGRVFGTGRLEPVALGGIHGKGLWLDGETGIAYDVPAVQPDDPDQSPWFASIFVDCRFSDDAVRRDVLVFPDGSRLQLEGRDVIRFLDPAGNDVLTHTLAPSQILPARGWAHLGLLIQPGGSNVKLYLDGDLIRTWSGALGQQIFRIVPGGTFFVGKEEGSTTSGLRGWIDEFKLFADEPGAEVICNHARGTMVERRLIETQLPLTTTELTPATSAWLKAIIAQPQPVSLRYCFHNYTVEQPGAHLENLPSGTRSLRRELLFPEGPLHYNLERPDSSNNAFCLSCHTSTHVTPSLRVDALVPNPGVLMQHDPRRQPLQPPVLIFGQIPADLYGPGVPASPLVAPPQGEEQDQWVFP